MGKNFKECIVEECGLQILVFFVRRKRRPSAWETHLGFTAVLLLIGGNSRENRPV